MFNELTQNETQTLIDGELGINVVRFMEIVESMGNNNIFVDIGVETGKSSKILLNKAIQKNNKVFGIDPIPNMGQDILDNPNYEYVNGDSVSTGDNRSETLKNKVSIAFVDSIHADVQVLCELRSWWPLIKENGWVIFHDTAWGGYVHKPGHPCAGKLTGNTAKGYDFYGGVAWPTPDCAVKQFFGLNDLVSYDDGYIHVEHSPKDLGMTFVQKKKHKDYSLNISNWNLISDRRNYLIKSFGA